jgi:hypothetical protein
VIAADEGSKEVFDAAIGRVSRRSPRRGMRPGQPGGVKPAEGPKDSCAIQELPAGEDRTGERAVNFRMRRYQHLREMECGTGVQD